MAAPHARICPKRASVGGKADLRPDAAANGSFVDIVTVGLSPAESVNHLDIAPLDQSLRRLRQDAGSYLRSLEYPAVHSKDMESAVKTLEAMPERTLESWNSFIVAACSRCILSQAKHALDKMPQQNTLSWNPLLHAYAVHGELQFAKQIFNQLPQRTLLTWTALLAGYVHQADVFLPEALELFQKMPQFDERSSTSVMKAFAEHGRVDEASKVFYGIPAASRDTVSWSTMLSGLAQAGQGWKALEMFHLMMLDGVSADGHCLTSLLLAWRHLGLVNQSIQLLLTMMDDHGVEPELEHFCCLVDVLGKLGRLEDAEKLLDDMPFLPNAVAWASLLGSCRTFQDASRGDRAARELMNLGDESVAYVLLASLYGGHKGVEALGGCLHRSLFEDSPWSP